MRRPFMVSNETIDSLSATRSAGKDGIPSHRSGRQQGVFTMVIRAQAGNRLIVEEGPIEAPELLRVCQQLPSACAGQAHALVLVGAPGNTRRQSKRHPARPRHPVHHVFSPRTTALALRVVAYLNALRPSRG